jgi:predicted nucleotidyltransferase
MGIAEFLQDKRHEVLALAARYGAKQIRVFGSVARGEARPDSDVDLLVVFEPGRSLFDHVGLTQELSDLLHRKVDVVSQHALHWYIRERVLREAVAL